MFEKYSNMKYYENPTSGSRVVQCKRTDRRTGRQTDGREVRQTDGRGTDRHMTKLIFVFRNFANASKIRSQDSDLPKFEKCNAGIFVTKLQQERM
jgi:hypothetical protein